MALRNLLDLVKDLGATMEATADSSERVAANMGKAEDSIIRAIGEARRAGDEGKQGDKGTRKGPTLSPNRLFDSEGSSVGPVAGADRWGGRAPSGPFAGGAWSSTTGVGGAAPVLRDRDEGGGGQGRAPQQTVSRFAAPDSFLGIVLRFMAAKGIEPTPANVAVYYKLFTGRDYLPVLLDQFGRVLVPTEGAKTSRGGSSGAAPEGGGSSFSTAPPLARPLPAAGPVPAGPADVARVGKSVTASGEAIVRELREVRGLLSANLRQGFGTNTRRGID